MLNHTFEQEIAINIVPPFAAEEVEMLNDENLNQWMKSSFSIVRNQYHTGSYVTNVGIKQYRGDIELTYTSLPANISFHAFYLDRSGKEYPVSTTPISYWVRRKTSQPGNFVITPGDLGIEKNGVYEGVLIIRPYLPNAYRFPDIRQIWGGELETPFTFEVKDL